MWKTARPVVAPGGPNELDLDYTQGGELAVPVSELGDYYRRLASWYTRGGFTELGRRHNSPHHFGIDCWEVLNETHPPFGEHFVSPRGTTRSTARSLPRSPRCLRPPGYHRRDEYLLPGFAVAVATMRRH